MQGMRFLALLAVGGVCFAVGWFTREATYEPPVERKSRSVVRRDDADRIYVSGMKDDSAAAAGETLKPVKSTSPVYRDATPGAVATPAGKEAAEVPAAGEDDGDPMAEMIRSQAPQWKAWATMQAKPMIASLLAGLGFDEETTRQIEEMMLADVEHQVERAMGMMLGEEDLDPNAFLFFMGVPPDLTPELERDLGTFLSDGEIADVRAEVKKTFRKQQDDMAEMQINLMGISDLSPDQRTRLKDVFVDKNMMQEQFTQFAEVSRDRSLFKKLVTGEIDLAEQMDKSMEPQRRRMSQILTPQQMEQYKLYEQQMIKQAEMGMKMMGAMYKKEPEPPAQDPEKKEGE